MSQDNFELDQVSISNGLVLHVGDKLLCTQELNYGEYSLSPSEIITVEGIEYILNEENIILHTDHDDINMLGLGRSDESGVDQLLSAGMLRIIELK